MFRACGARHLDGTRMRNAQQARLEIAGPAPAYLEKLNDAQRRAVIHGSGPGEHLDALTVGFAVAVIATVFIGKRMPVRAPA